VPPKRSSGRNVESFDHLVVLDPVEEDEAFSHDDGTGEALPDLLLPQPPRAVFEPLGSNRRSGVNAVSLRPEKLGPVVPGGDDEGEDEDQALQRAP